MAQRVFQGMLNETLSILTVRYTQVGIILFECSALYLLKYLISHTIIAHKIPLSAY